MPSSLRSSARRPSDMQSLGIEDEMSFGSDEDLLETIGEIDLPEEVPEVANATAVQNSSRRSASAKLKSSSSRLGMNKRKDKDSSASLGASTHVLSLASESTLDLTDMGGDRERGDRPKRGSIMGTLKSKKNGLRSKFRDDSSRTSFMTNSSGSTTSLDKITSDTSSRSRPSATTSSHTGGSTVPHILPSLDTVDRLSLGRQSLGSVSVESKSPSINSYLPPSPRKSAAAAAAAWKAAQISTAILPGFPATTTGLQSITVFTAQAFKRPPSSILSGAERSPNGFRQPTGAARAWPACTLVFTLFKLSLLGHDAATDLAGGDDERTVAHVHIFSAPHATSATHRRPGRTSVAGQYDSVQPVERERRMLSSESTASVYDNYTDTEGRRRSVLSIYFENDRTKGNEWVLEMKDAGQQYECIRQIKKTATMIKAEEAGCGQAIRPLYEDATISAENLARELEVHKLAAAKKREAVANATATAAATAATGSATAEQRGAAVPAPPHPHHRPVAAPQAQVHTQVEQSRSSLDVIQSVAMGRSQSVDTPEAHPAITVSHRKSPSTESIEAAMASLSTSVGAHHIGRDMLAADDKLDLNRISALNFASTFSFPAPPSDLPQSPRSATHANATSSPTHSSPVRPHAPTNPFGARSSQSLTPSLSDDDADDEADNVVVSPPTPPLRPTRPATPPRSGTQTPSAGNASVTVAVPRPGSIASTLNSEHSSTSRLRRLRAKPQVIDIMAEFSAVEAENMPPPEDEIGAEPIREDRERKIRFA